MRVLSPTTIKPLGTLSPSGQGEAETRAQAVARAAAERADLIVMPAPDRVHEVTGATLAKAPLPDDSAGALYLSQSDVTALRLLAWLPQALGPLRRLTVVTYNLNLDAIEAIARYLDAGTIEAGDVVVSQSFQSRMPARVERLRHVWAERRDRLRVSMCWNHAKLILAESADGRCVTVTTSANFSFNASLEQLCVFAGRPLYESVRAIIERRCFTERMNKRHEVWGCSDETTSW